LSSRHFAVEQANRQANQAEWLALLAAHTAPGQVEGAAEVKERFSFMRMPCPPQQSSRSYGQVGQSHIGQAWRQA
jgi:hypothetical protein